MLAENDEQVATTTARMDDVREELLGIDAALLDEHDLRAPAHTRIGSRPAIGRDHTEDAPRTGSFSVHFARGKTRHRRLQRGPEPPAPAHGQVPRIARVLALGHYFLATIRAGDVADYVDLASLTGFTRARITQVMDLTLLAPDIQEQILTWPRVTGERGAPSEKRVLGVAREVVWGRQRERWLRVGPHGT